MCQICGPKFIEKKNNNNNNNNNSFICIGLNQLAQQFCVKNMFNLLDWLIG